MAFYRMPKMCVATLWHEGVRSPSTKSCMLPAGYGPEDQGYFSLELTYNYGKVCMLCSEGSC
jgi:hypothetical protein